MPEFEPLTLLACRDGFEEQALVGMAISPSGKQFFLAGSKLTLWNIGDPKPTADLLAKYTSKDLERPLSVVTISDDGKWVAAGDQNGRVRLWSVNDQRELGMLTDRRGRVTQLAFSPNSRLLATTDYSGNVDLWQMPDCKPLKSLKLSDQAIIRMAFLSDDMLAATSREVSLWDVPSGKKATALTTGLVRYPALSVSRDRRLLVFNDADANAQFWDATNSKLTGVVLRGATPGLSAFSHDDKWLATHSGDSTIRVYDTASGRVLQAIDADGDTTTALEWLPSENVLLVASLDGRVRMWGTAESARKIGVDPMPSPALPATAAAPRTSLNSAQFQEVVDLRSLPQLPGAVPQYGDYDNFSYSAPVSQEEATLFYRHILGKAGWTEEPVAPGPGTSVFRKNDCELTVSMYPAGTGGDKNLQISTHFSGNYDARWLPRTAPIESNANFASFSSVMYRTRASLVDTEVAVLRQFHEAGWTPYTRLGSSSAEDPNVRHISMVQRGSVLTIMISHPADSKEELVVQSGVGVSNKTLPIPADAGWIEFDHSTELQMVANTRMDLSKTIQFFDKTMAAEGWLARDDGRQIKEDKAWLPYIRGQKDVLIRLSARPSGGTRIVVGEAEKFSWQLQKPVEPKKQTDRPGLEAADFALPTGATEIKYDVDEKMIEFALANTTPPRLAAEVAKPLEATGWKRTTSGVMSDEYVLMTFAKGKAEISLRARAADKATSASISGDGLLWIKPLPVAPVVTSYETWLRRNRKDATLDLLDDFSAEMHRIQAAGKGK